MKIALISVGTLAIILGIVTYFAVFSGTQVIEPVASNTNSSGSGVMVLPAINSSSSATSTSRASSSTQLAGGSSAGNGGSTASQPSFQSIFSSPYPVVWSEGKTQFAIAGASLQGNNLTLLVNLQTGSDSQCIPLNLRFITDEEGDMQAPNEPTTQNFPLNGDADCAGTPNTSYPNQSITFTVNPASTPFIFTTAGTSNVYFEVATSTNGQLQVSIPQAAG